MRIAFIDPSYYLHGELLRLRSIGYPALTMPALAADVPPGHEVRLFHEKCEPLPLEEELDLVLFTTMGTNLVRACELSDHFRSRGAVTAVGGWTAMAYEELCRERFDVLVKGEGEGAIRQLVEDVERGAVEPVYENWFPDLTQLSRPRYDLVNPAHWGAIVPVDASRGCPNRCDFCVVSRYTKRHHRTLEVERVVENIEFARETFGKSMFYFTDPNFGVNRRHAMELMERLEPLGIDWLASVDIRVLDDDEFLAAARRSGCFTLQVGFETTDQASLENAGKAFNQAAEFSRLVRKSHDHGIPVTALMMVGFDSDTEETFREVLDFLEENRIPLVVLHVLTPVRGTELYARIEREGRLLGDPLEEGDGLHLYIEPRSMSVEQFQQAFRRTLDEAFSFGSLFWRYFHRGVCRNPRAWIILLLTSLFATRKALKMGYPPGMYE